MDNIASLIFLYVFIVLVNTILSTILWLSNRTSHYKYLVLVWGTTVLSMFVQGILMQNNLMIALSLVSNYVNNITFAYLVTKNSTITPPWKFFTALLTISYIPAFISFFNGYSFLLVTIFPAIATALPLLHSSTYTLVKDWKTLTISGKALSFTCFIFGLHYLDYPFLRSNPSILGIGFTVGIIIIFALSIFSLAVVLEAVAAAEAKVSAEVNVAHRIQGEIVPKHPKIPNYTIACYMNPVDEVGGDYYDIFTQDDHSWIIIGDVVGHGLGSGLVMFMLQSIVSSVIETRKNIQPKQLNYIANKILYKNLIRLNEQRPATIGSFCLIGNEIIVSGSHDNIFIYRNDSSKVEVINLNHFPIGLGFTDELDELSIGQIRLNMHENDILLLTTDGISEATKDGLINGELFGEERLMDLLKTNSDKSVDEIKDIIVRTLAKFTHSNFHDDITFILAKFCNNAQ